MSGASRTARHMAFFRALEAARRRDRLFEEPLAPIVLPLPLRLLCVFARARPVGEVIERFVDWRWPGARASGVARTCLIDLWTDQTIADGAQQLVILGAGFDARPYRLPALDNVPIFEVDQPAMVQAKAEVVQRLRALPSRDVTYVPVDFIADELGERLERAAVRADLASCVIWEGVTNYLTDGAVSSTLDELERRTAPGSRLLWTYIHRGAIDGTHQFEAVEASRRAVERGGERWTFGLVPDEVPAYLKQHGWRLIEDLSSTDYRRRFMKRRGRHMQGYEFYRAAYAENVGRAGTGRRH